MAGERRVGVIAAMNLPQLQANKAALSAELRVAVTKWKTYAPSLGGVMASVGDAAKTVFTSIPEALWRGKMVDYHATDPSAVLAGIDSGWSDDIQQLATALAATNARIADAKAAAAKKDEDAAAQTVRSEQTGGDAPSTPAAYYARLQQIYKDSDVPGKGKPASSDPTEVARAAQWMKENTQFIESIPIDMRLQIVQYGLQDNRWQGDFK